MDPTPEDGSPVEIGGGSCVEGRMDTACGDFAERDKTIRGHEVPGDQITTHIGAVTGPVHTGSGDIIVGPPVPRPPEPEPPAFRVLTVVARPLDQAALPQIGDVWSLADRLAQVQAPIELAFARPPTVGHAIAGAACNLRKG